MPEEGSSLVMPFVVVASQGGPYDDASFVAAARFEACDADLRPRKVSP